VLTPEEMAKANKTRKKERTAEEDAAKIEKDCDELYAACEARLEESWTGKKNTSVAVCCKYRKVAAIDEVIKVFKLKKWKATKEFLDPGDGKGKRYHIVFTA